MLLTTGEYPVKIRTVLFLEWEENNTYIPPRRSNALSFRLKGNSDFITKDKRIHVGDKELLFVPEDFPYEIKAGPEQLIVIHFEALERIPDEFQAMRPYNPQRIEELFLSLLNTWEEKQPGYYPRALSIFYKILELISKDASINVHSAHYEKIRHAVDYLMKNYRSSDLSVQELCKRCDISDTYFRKCFLDEFHATPNKFLTTLRIEHAKELLESGVYSVEQVAERSGFMEPKYFCTVFKKMVGKTPSEYKKQISYHRDD